MLFEYFPSVIARGAEERDLLVVSVPDHERPRFLIDVSPPDTAYLLLSHRRGNSKPHDAANGDRLAGIVLEVIDQGPDFG
jgi:hypothetical protein